MALKDLVLKTKQALTAEAAGSEFKFCELTPDEEVAARAIASKRVLEKNPTAKQEEVDVYLSQYLAYTKLVKGGEPISEAEFFALGSLYIGEVVMAMEFRLREAHPTYFEKFQKMQAQSRAQLQDLLDQTAKK